MDFGFGRDLPKNGLENIVHDFLAVVEFKASFLRQKVFDRDGSSAGTCPSSIITVFENLAEVSAPVKICCGIVLYANWMKVSNITQPKLLEKEKRVWKTLKGDKLSGVIEQLYFGTERVEDKTYHEIKTMIFSRKPCKISSWLAVLKQ